jgi:galactokinase
MRRDDVTAIFVRYFQQQPDLWVRAPGRVDLMGSHTDYNLGFVLTMAISRDTWIAARATGTSRVRLLAANLDSQHCFEAVDVLVVRDRSRAPVWSDYVRGVAWALQRAGFPLSGFDAVIHSTVPIGSGLSSSAALECAVATVFQSLGGWQIDPALMARLCQRAENEYVGVDCGILDQYSSCLGRSGCALLLDCRDLTTRRVPIAGGIRVMICDTRSRRELAGGEYGVRRSQCENGAAFLGVPALRDATLFHLRTSGLAGDVQRRCRFIIGENDRVLRLAGALTAGDRKQIRRLCAESFAGARDLYDICSSSMISMMEAMEAAPGLIGARQAGAGFGGCMVAFVESSKEVEFASSVGAAYHTAAGVRPEVYAVEAADGAGLLDAS